LRSFQWRITIPIIIIIIVSLGTMGIYLNSSMRNSQLANLQFQLEQEAKIIAETALPALINRDATAADSLAKTLGKNIDTRVTIIAPDGTVLGDSDQNPAIMENHSSRPEVQAALAKGLGQATRYSTTLKEEMMYVAVAVKSGGDVVGIARVSLPLATVNKDVNHVTGTIILTTVIITVLAVLATWLITRTMTHPIRELTKTAKSIASGQIGQKIIANTRDEMGQLAKAFKEMTANLRATMDTMSEEKNKLDTVLHSMGDGVIMTDVNGEIILANRAAGTLLGFKEGSVFGKPVIEAVHDHEIDDILKSCLNTGQERTSQFESSVTRRFLRAIAIPLQSKGKGNGGLILVQDLTEVRNMQTMRRELVGNISHELRTPIAGIKAMAETLLDSALNDKTASRDFVSRIEGEADRLAQMVTELTQLSRIESGHTELKKEPVDLNSLISEIVAELNPLAERQHINLTQQPSPDLPLVKLDRDRIKQTIINLIHNAIKFNTPGGRVTVTTGNNEKFVTVEVEDNGTGISRDDLPHVFERFYKADKARTGNGSGLGLAIAKHTIQAHGGEIRARSEEGKGSVFTINLPRG
jgi:two-component system, OmpR family, phosphate regulon sensor histidine kinase PhoR